MNILHLSDIHFNSEDFTNEFLEQEISAITKAVNDWKNKEEQELNYVFVSGDIVQAGAYNEYEIADVFFSKLAKNLNLKRNKISQTERAYKEQLISDKISYFDLSNLKKDIYDKQKELLYGKFEFYNQFVSKYSTICSIRDLENISDSYKFHYVSKEKSFYIIGLNTVLLSSENDPDHKFLFVQEQIKELENNIEEESNILFIMHHSYSFLHRMEENYFAKFIAKHGKTLIFCGHYHDSLRSRSVVDEKWITECREAAFLASDTQERAFSIVNVDFDEDKYCCYKFTPNEKNHTFEWKYNKLKYDSISYKTREEIENKINLTLPSNNDRMVLTQEKVLFDFIFGNISTQFDSLNDLNSYLESLFLKENKQEFINIAERTFEIFNNTPLLNVLRNYIIKVIVQYSDDNNNIENSSLFEKKEVLEMLMNILNVFVINYSEFQLSQISYWVDFIDRNMSQIPEKVLGVVTNVLSISLKKIKSEESQG